MTAYTDRMTALQTDQGSELERNLAWQIAVDRTLPVPLREHLFYEGRRFRFDFAWPDHQVAAEVDGGTYTNGRHTRGHGYAKDCEKNNLAVLSGWRVLRFTAADVENGSALNVIHNALRLLGGAA